MVVPYDSYDYPAFWVGREYEDDAERIALKRLFRKIGEVGNLLEIGGGFGRLIPSYLSLARKICLIDPSESLLSIAKKKYQDKKQISFQKASLPNLPFQDSNFQTVVIVRVTHHLPDLKLVFKEVYRVLEPGGFLILEFANKVHFLGRLKALLQGNFSFASNLETIDKRSRESIKQGKILFLNHHPRRVINNLREENFKVIDVLSVSNFRNPIMKRIIPRKALLFVESMGQRFLARFYFGPSIFVLAKRAYNT
jgi:ubiquinone/menaquinone biosynthesis C-methylase UbiE